MTDKQQALETLKAFYKDFNHVLPEIECCGIIDTISTLEGLVEQEIESLVFDGTISVKDEYETYRSV